MEEELRTVLICRESTPEDSPTLSGPTTMRTFAGWLCSRSSSKTAFRCSERPDDSLKYLLYPHDPLAKDEGHSMDLRINHGIMPLRPQLCPAT